VATLSKGEEGGIGVVGIATRYGLDGPRFAPRCGKEVSSFSIPVQKCSGAHPASGMIGTRALSWGEATGGWR
jgi:hypothetical protein